MSDPISPPTAPPPDPEADLTNFILYLAFLTVFVGLYLLITRLPQARVSLAALGGEESLAREARKEKKAYLLALQPSRHQCSTPFDEKYSLLSSDYGTMHPQPALETRSEGKCTIQTPAISSELSAKEAKKTKANGPVFVTKSGIMDHRREAWDAV